MSYVNQLAARQRHIRDLRVAMLAIVIVAVAAMYFVYLSPRHLSLHLAPNPRVGDVVTVHDGVSPVPAVNVYGFGYYIWQQLNRWANDGSKDYGQQLYLLQHYLTPACQQQLRSDLEQRAVVGELQTRTRWIAEIAGQAFNASRVVVESDNAWTVVLDMQVMETVRGAAVKDTYVRYPIRVVRYDVDRERNPWALALDCFGGNRPERLDPSVVAAGAPLLSATQLKAAPLPAPLAPPAAASGVEPR